MQKGLCVQLLKIHRLLWNYIFVTPFTLTLRVSALHGHHQVFILPSIDESSTRLHMQQDEK
jgi:hypothetical protein